MRQFTNTLNRRTVTQFPSLASLFDHEQEFEKYECIYYMGDTAAQVYMVKEGKVKLSRISSTGKEKVLDIFEPGEIFGELSLYAEGIRSEQAVAMENVKVASVEKSELLRYVASRPAVAADLLRLLSFRLAEAQDQIETLSFDKTSERLAKTLLRMGEDFGLRDIDGKLKIHHSYTHEELAQIIGTSREIISSAMASFQKEGYIRYKRKNIEIIPEKIIHYLNSA
jgi:CRP/FNR family cyclic AMP-dependent transcriptional regulator